MKLETLIKEIQKNVKDQKQLESLLNTVRNVAVSIDYGKQPLENISFLKKYTNLLSNVSSLEIETILFVALQNNHLDYLYDCIRSFPQIISLRIRIGMSNAIGTGGIQILLQESPQQTQLKYLQINICSSNYLNGQGAMLIGQYLTNCISLESLELTIQQENLIGKQGALGISKGMKSLTNLTRLSLNIDHSNGITCDGYQQLGLVLQKLDNLRELNLKLEGILKEVDASEVSNTNKVEDAISRLYSNVEQLVRFSIEIDQKERLKNDEFKQLCFGIKQLKRLEKLEMIIRKNQIENEGFQDIIDVLKSQKVLKSLKLVIEQYNFIDSCSQTQLLMQLIFLQKLEDLFLDIREYYDYESAFQSVLFIIENLKSLTKLMVSIIFHNFTYEHLFSLFSSLNKLSKLRQLSVIFFSSQLTLENYIKIAQQICQLNQLNVLVIRFLSYSITLENEQSYRASKQLLMRKSIKLVHVKINNI